MKLVLAENRFKGKEAGRALGDMLAANSVLKELDLSNQGGGHPSNDQIDAAFAKEFAVGLGANGALTSLNLSKNDLTGYYDDNDEWISDMSGVTALAAALPECR